ncbi:MAG: hypothetical protein B6D53_04030 [Candidatus Omnitrophica bacterium 4484_49]|nr:MAG: hypothetical protein B6D53_04030 [Candidatus Omnitrophica bacterium 4484_49]
MPEEIKHYFETFQHEYDKDKKQFYHFDTEKILPYKKEKERKDSILKDKRKLLRARREYLLNEINLRQELNKRILRELNFEKYKICYLKSQLEAFKLCSELSFEQIHKSPLFFVGIKSIVNFSPF